MRPLTLLLLAGLLAGCASRTYTEAEFKRPSYTECTAGDCKNGVGTLRYRDGTEITGQRVNGEQIAGTYQVRWPCLQGKVVSLTYDSAQRPVSGTVERACVSDAIALSKPPRAAIFTGTFSSLNNPFTRETVSSYKSGTYLDGSGISWEGEFDYIPIRDSVELPGYGKTFMRSGAFVFVGAKIDPELDEVTRGLFISEPTRPGEDIRLIRARPDYLEALRSNYLADRAANAAELAEEKRASREAFSTFLNIATTAAVIYGNSRAMAAADRATLESMTGIIRGERPSTPPAARAASAKAPAPVSVAEFRRLQSAANNASNPSANNSTVTETRSPSTRTPPPAAAPPATKAPAAPQRATAPTPAAPTPAAPAQNAASAPRTYPGLPRVRTQIWDSQFTGKQKADNWCTTTAQKLRNDFVGSKNDFISTGACSCETARNSVANTMPGVFEKEYYCKIDYTWRQNVPDNSR